jgi:hypothetical protein
MSFPAAPALPAFHAALLQFVIPFLQPTFIYGDTSKTAQQQTITNVKEG